MTRVKGPFVYRPATRHTDTLATVRYATGCSALPVDCGGPIHVCELAA